MTKLIDIIAGARPNFMKIAPIIAAIKNSELYPNLITFRLIHTGQHYDKNMSETFFNELNIPIPDVNLQTGSGTQAEQTAKIMIGYEQILLQKPSDLCIVVGDVTSTMACSITAKKMNVKVAHVEAGIRSWDITMPEEINRMVTDSITDYFFTTSEVANENLKKIGIEDNRIFFVGNTMIDTLLTNQNRFHPPSIWEEYNLKSKEYIVITLHRPSNVDDEKNLKKILTTIKNVSNGYKLLFPIHPRTAKVLERIHFINDDLILTQPMGYLEFNYLVKNARAIITDSGGITEETTVMGIPCLTLRDSTERPETCDIGTNELVGNDSKKLAYSLQKIYSGEWKKGGVPQFWDGNTSKRIVNTIKNLIDTQQL